MLLIKKINNNFALAEDSSGKKLIVEGKGIGFNKMPCTVNDLSLISRTYYDFDDEYMYLLNTLSQEVIDVAHKIYQKLITYVQCQVNENLPFILADHINFAIERQKKGITVKMPLYYDLIQIYPLEYEVAKYGLKIIKSELDIELPHDEVSGIMLNIINAEFHKDKISKEKDYEFRNTQVTHIIENCMNISLSKDSFNYSRFVTHMNYLYERVGKDSQIHSDNKQMYDTVVHQYPQTVICVVEIAKFLSEHCKIELNEEERLYLILHINRLCERELGL